jgi:alkylation response protein AidB-like acyl-CoA dehydrogenase
MRFHLSDDQEDIRRTARELLADRSPFERVREHAEARDYDATLWREVCDLGWPGIAVAEEHGGQGLGMVELAILAEQVGYACAAIPLVGTTLATAAIGAGGGDEQRARWLPGLAGGELRGACGGVGELIADAGGADVVVTAGPAPGLVEGSAVVPEQAIDPTRRYGRVPSGGAERLAGDAAGAVDRALVGISAELVGLAQRALDMTVEYVRERRQFGVAVGSFQAVQHRAAQMLLDVESARAATLFAAWTADAEPERLPLAAAMAKASSAEAGRSVTAGAIQLHGGIGFTWEADVHWLYKRAQLDAALFGGPGRHRRRVTELAAGVSPA